MTQQSTGSDQERVGGSVGDQIVVLNPQRDLAQLGCFNGDRAIVDLTAARVSRLGQISAPLPSQAQSAQERFPLGQPRRRCVRRFALVEELVSMVRSPCSFQRPWCTFRSAFHHLIIADVSRAVVADTSFAFTRQRIQPFAPMSCFYCGVDRDRLLAHNTARSAPTHATNCSEAPTSTTLSPLGLFASILRYWQRTKDYSRLCQL
ncbi:unnamed protein product [Tilletia controversa]|nr:unnamed protein product [Tilletia controversa]CAD6919117.1 unnamed protein product [Tilletia controversa]CAD6922311.1 unnamed protein product [Tilletia controversa]CAD6971789.1 unnamed protein product [Tilletia controversa]